VLDRECFHEEAEKRKAKARAATGGLNEHNQKEHDDAEKRKGR
jgi:hypothetical protein